MTGWDGTGIDPWLPHRLAAETAISTAERNMYKAWWGSFSDWLVQVHRSVMAGEQPDPNGVWSQEPDWQDRMAAFIQGPVRDTIGLAYETLLGPGYQFDARPAVTTHLAQVRNRMVHTPETVYDTIAATIARGAGNGDSIPTIASRVSDVLTATGTPEWRSRAVTVARTESLGALNAGRSDAYVAVAEVLDTEMEHQWVSTLDARCRPAHVEADGQRAPVGQPFIVMGEPLMFPGDPAGSAANTIQCRCAEILLEEGEEVDQTGRGFTDDDEWWAEQDTTVAAKVEEAAVVGPPMPSRDARPLAEIFDEATAAKPTAKSTAKASLADGIDGRYAGLDVKVSRASTWLGGLRYSGTIKDQATGKSVGSFVRLVGRDNDGRLYAVHELLKIKPKYQGSGFQAEFNGNLIDWYRRSGVEYVKVGANIDVGGYAWARAGYDFADTSDALGLVGRLQNQMSRIDGEPLRQLRWLDDRHDIPSWRFDGPVVFEAEPAWSQAKLRQTFKGASDAEIERQLDIGRAFLESLEGKTFGVDLPSAYELSQLGRWEGAGKDDIWIGKEIMLGSSWLGVLRL